MTNQFAAQFLMEMGDDIKAIRKHIEAPGPTEETCTEQERRITELETAIGEAIHLLSDPNTPFPNRTFTALSRLQKGLEDEIPF